jgi:hypothetical protein
MFIMPSKYVLKPSFVVEPALMYFLHLLVVFIIFVAVWLHKRTLSVSGKRCIGECDSMYKHVKYTNMNLKYLPTLPLLWTWWQKITCKGSEGFSSWIFIRTNVKAKDNHPPKSRSWCFWSFAHYFIFSVINMQKHFNESIIRCYSYSSKHYSFWISRVSLLTWGVS